MPSFRFLPGFFELTRVNATAALLDQAMAHAIWWKRNPIHIKPSPILAPACISHWDYFRTPA
jgi:hypothetical protein